MNWKLSQQRLITAVMHSVPLYAMNLAPCSLERIAFGWWPEKMKAMRTAESRDNGLTHAFLSMALDKGFLPGDAGAVYVYHAVKLTIDEMLGE